MSTSTRVVEGRWTSRVRRVLVVAAAVGLAVAAAVAPTAQASQPFAGRGAIGPVELYQGQCFFYPYWSRLDAQSVAPRIWAPNVRRGWGNDGAYARWRLHLADSTGRTIKAGDTYSPYGYVTDNRVGSPGGAQAFSGVADNSRLVVYVEWRNRSAQKIGWASYHVPGYALTTGGVGPMGPLGACVRVFPSQQGLPIQPVPPLPYP